jgi:thiol-disulfide isomerase/thioredoxin
MLNFCKAIFIGTVICSHAMLGFAQNIPKNGDVAPDIILPNASGTPIHLSSLRGKVVLIDFWASWCGPCRMANEETIEVYQEYQPKGFEIFSVSLDRKKTINSLGLTMAVIIKNGILKVVPATM